MTVDDAAQKVQSAVAKLIKKRREHKASVLFEEFNDNPVDVSVDIQLGLRRFPHAGLVLKDPTEKEEKRLITAFTDYQKAFVEMNAEALKQAKSYRWEALCKNGAFKTRPHLAGDDAQGFEPLAVSAAVDKEAGVLRKLSDQETAYLSAWKSSPKATMAMDAEKCRRWEAIFTTIGGSEDCRRFRSKLLEEVQSHLKTHVLEGVPPDASSIRVATVLEETISKQLDPWEVAVDVYSGIDPSVTVQLSLKTGIGLASADSKSIRVAVMPLLASSRMYLDEFMKQKGWKAKCEEIQTFRWIKFAAQVTGSKEISPQVALDAAVDVEAGCFLDGNPLTGAPLNYLTVFKRHPGTSTQLQMLKVKRFHEAVFEYHARNALTKKKYHGTPNEDGFIFHGSNVGNGNRLYDATSYILDVADGLEEADGPILKYQAAWEAECAKLKTTKEERPFRNDALILHPTTLYEMRKQQEDSRATRRSIAFERSLGLSRSSALNEGSAAEAAPQTLMKDVRSRVMNAWNGSRMSSPASASAHAKPKEEPKPALEMTTVKRCADNEETKNAAAVPTTPFEQCLSVDDKIALAALQATAATIGTGGYGEGIPLASPSHPNNIARTPRAAREEMLRAQAWVLTHPELMERARMIKAWKKLQDEADDAASAAQKPLPPQKELESWFALSHKRWKCSCNHRFASAGELFKHQGMEGCSRFEMIRE